MINKSRIYIGDVYYSSNVKTQSNFKIEPTGITGVTFDEDLYKKDQILIKFGKKFVQLSDIYNFPNYLSINLEANLKFLKNSHKFIGTYPDYWSENKSRFFVKNEKQMFEAEGYISLKELKSKQKLLDLTNEKQM